MVLAQNLFFLKIAPRFQDFRKTDKENWRCITAPVLIFAVYSYTGIFFYSLV